MRIIVSFLLILFSSLVPLNTQAQSVSGEWQVDLATAVRDDCEDPVLGESHLGTRTLKVVQKGSLVQIVDKNITESLQKMYGSKTKRRFSASAWNSIGAGDSIIRVGASYTFVLKGSRKNADVIFKFFYLSGGTGNAPLTANDCEYQGTATRQ
jgi:hypothetical protein